jgi:hypothetical protein
MYIRLVINVSSPIGKWGVGFSVSKRRTPTPEQAAFSMSITKKSKKKPVDETLLTTKHDLREGNHDSSQFQEQWAKNLFIAAIHVDTAAFSFHKANSVELWSFSFTWCIQPRHWAANWADTSSPVHVSVTPFYPPFVHFTLQLVLPVALLGRHTTCMSVLFLLLIQFTRLPDCASAKLRQLNIRLHMCTMVSNSQLYIEVGNWFMIDWPRKRIVSLVQGASDY